MTAMAGYEGQWDGIDAGYIRSEGFAALEAGLPHDFGVVSVYVGRDAERSGFRGVIAGSQKRSGTVDVQTFALHEQAEARLRQTLDRLIRDALGRAEREARDIVSYAANQAKPTWGTHVTHYVNVDTLTSAVRFGVSFAEERRAQQERETFRSLVNEVVHEGREMTYKVQAEAVERAKDAGRDEAREAVRRWRELRRGARRRALEARRRGLLRRGRR